jgi:nitrilase
VRIPSDVTDRLCSVAQRARINVVVGVIECDDTGDQPTCYSTLLCINAQGRIVGTYRAACSSDAAQLKWIPAAGVRLTDEAPAMSRVGGI